MSHFDHHPPCSCGCGELADECSGRRPNPLGSMRITVRHDREWFIARARAAKEAGR